MKQRYSVSQVRWVQNTIQDLYGSPDDVEKIIPPGISRLAKSFHRQIPGYRITPLRALDRLAEMFNLGRIWVKDESQRLNLKSFRILGDIFAIYCFIKQKLNMQKLDIPFVELTSSRLKKELGNLVFATATDGNHGYGVAWAAGCLGFRSVIYIQRGTCQARIDEIKGCGADTRLIAGNYSDVVNKVITDADKYGWHIISDISRDGYEQIPAWIMQGYTTIFQEIQEQLTFWDLVRPTHIFIQAGLGALAAAATGFYCGLFKKNRPVSIIVEPDKAACLHESVLAADGEPHRIDGYLNTNIYSLACKEPSPLAWRVLQQKADYFLSCPDYIATQGMKLYDVPLLGDPSIVSGESGAITLGALISIMEDPNLSELREKLNLGKESQILLINTEGKEKLSFFS